MFQVILNMDHGTSIENIKKILPNWWTVCESCQDQKTFNLFCISDTSHNAGQVQVLREGVPGKILIKADESTDLGRRFWSDFAVKYHELDPFHLRFGVIFLSDDNVAELDELSMDQSVDRDLLQHYSMVKDAYYVSFWHGDWHSRKWIQVQTIARILEDGSIEDAPDMPKQFALASQ